MSCWASSLSILENIDRALFCSCLGHHFDGSASMFVIIVTFAPPEAKKRFVRPRLDFMDSTYNKISRTAKDQDIHKGYYDVHKVYIKFASKKKKKDMLCLISPNGNYS